MPRSPIDFTRLACLIRPRMAAKATGVVALTVLAGLLIPTPAQAESDSNRRPLRSYRQQLSGEAVAGEGTAVAPSVPYSYWNWSSTNYTSVEETLTVKAHTAGVTYFWAHQFAFNGGDQGYIGLQDGSYPNGGEAALFSIWQANAAAGANCGTFGGEGTGYSCRIDPFDWVKGRAYRLQVARTAQDSFGTWYTGSVVDTSNGTVHTIGSIRVAPEWGGIQGWVSWTEYFGAPFSNCADIPVSSVQWASPTANNGTVKPTGTASAISSGLCTSYTKISSVKGGGALQEVGVAPPTRKRR